jgi:uncharacterized protein (DUF3084 family)
MKIERLVLIIALVLLLAWLIYSLTAFTSPASAQAIITPTPLPQVQATQQAAQTAAAGVNDLQAEKAQAQARLDEINRNIEAQIAAAERAAADARTAAATQNAVEAGAAIGRLEGALDQLRASYAGKDAIINDLATRNDQQAAQIADLNRAVGNITRDNAQLKRDANSANLAYQNLKMQTEQGDRDNLLAQIVFIGAFGLVALIIGTLVYETIRKHRDDPPKIEHEDVIDSEAHVVEDDDRQ